MRTRRPSPFRRRRRAWRPAAFDVFLIVAVALLLTTVGFQNWPPRTEMASAAVRSAANRIAGQANVIDGDTFDLNGVRVRLWGVDAPEREQLCTRGAPGPQASAALRDAINGQRVSCTVRDTDTYGRTVAQCSVGGGDLGDRLVREGWAWDYARFSGGRYRSAETNARSHDRGVWELGCAPAWEWRRAHQS